VHELIPAHHVPGLQCIVFAADVRDRPAGFPHHDLLGGNVPRLQIAFPVAVEAAGGVHSASAPWRYDRRLIVALWMVPVLLDCVQRVLAVDQDPQRGASRLS
jgi:hypothetical protein